MVYFCLFDNCVCVVVACCFLGLIYFGGFMW